ncbi:MAG: GH3 auxin-responsive promoter family protein [Sandaracinaceae bacterium]
MSSAPQAGTPSAPRAKAPLRRVDPHRPLKKTIYPAVVGQGLRAAATVRVALWDRALRRVREVQEAQLLRMVRHAQDTAFGRRYGFSTIRRFEDYVSRVPIGDYDSFAPYLERMRKGERNLLVPEFVSYFGNSSGSSTQGQSKFLPISERQVRDQRRSASDVLYRYLVWRGEGEFTSGFTLGLFPPITMKKEGPVYITTNPSLQSQRMPAFTKPAHLPEEDIRRIDDYAERLSLIVERYFDHDVRAVAATTCWFSVLFDRLLEAARDRGYAVDSVTDIWPNLRVLIGGGVSPDPYMPVIRERVGRDDIVLIDTYNATEGGVYATSDYSGERGMLMIPDRGVFHELVPAEELDEAWPTRLPLWEAERDRLYALHVTTLSGLYSYRLGDLVRFPTIDPLRIEFAGRIQGCLSTTQELTTHVEIQASVEHALAAVGARSVDYGAGGDVGVEGTGLSRYVLFVEFDGEPPDLDRFRAAFDEELCRQNRVYREHRNGDIGILKPEIVSMPRGTVRAFLDRSSHGNLQAKFPRILDDKRKDMIRSMLASA